MDAVRSQSRRRQQAGGAEPQPRRRWQPAGVGLELLRAGQVLAALAELVGDQLGRGETVPQRGRHDAARARADDHVDLGQGAADPLLDRGQAADRPGRPERATRAQHQPDALAARHVLPPRTRPL
jgi:hypothetical protein